MSSNRITIEDLGVFALLARALDAPPPDLAGTGRRSVPMTGARAPRRRLLARMEHWLWKRDQRALDAYLGQAKDVYELEARIRDLERRTVGGLGSL